SGAFKDDISKDRYIDIANYDGYNLLFWGTRNGDGNYVKLSANSGGGTKSYMAFFFEKDGEIYVQFMLASGITVGTVEGLPDYVQVPKWSQIEVVKWSEMVGVNTTVTNDLLSKDTPRAFICGKSQSNNGLAWMDYMYFAKGNVVYCLDFETKNLYEYYKLPEGVNVKLLELNFHDTELAIYADDNTFRTIKCSPSNLNNFDYDSKLTTDVIENMTGVKQIIYVRSSKSAFTMPTSNPDRIVWP
ncbi:MAG: hypothetical protein IKT28_01480, partial [Rikenellaceae bacterium]|nr:hypothetical protein [Rikenellaceae bacterium]